MSDETETTTVSTPGGTETTVETPAPSEGDAPAEGTPEPVEDGN